MIYREFFRFVLLMAVFSTLFGQEKAGIRSIPRGALQEKIHRPGELVTPEKIHPQVRAQAQANALIPVFVVLVHQPQKEIFERAQAASRLRREIVEGRYRQLENMLFPAPEALQQAREAVDQVEVETRQSAFLEIDDSIAAEQVTMETDLAGMGGRNISRYRGVNMLAVEIPSSALPLLESDPRIAEVALIQGHPAQLATSAPALGAPTFWSNGYTGEGQSVAVLDTGVRTNHPAFAGKSIISQVFLAYASTRSCFEDDAASAEDKQGHGTHVAGIVMSQGSGGWASYQGVAKGISTLYNAKIAFNQGTGAGCQSGAGYTYYSDTFAGLEWLVAHTPVKVASFSFGGATSQDDTWEARMWDQYVDNYGLAATLITGNSGPSSTTVISPGIAYNVISAANWATRGSVYYTSGRGPTTGGRYKPDIAAPGTSIVSTAWNWDVASPFFAMTGTSMAAPHVAGSLSLLRSTGITNPLAAKAVLLNTTDNTGWAPDRGWGYANLTRAWEQRSFATGSLTASGAPTSYALYKNGSSGSLSATLTWNRHIVGGSTSSFNDIDLYLYESSAGGVLDASEEEIQNVEQVSSSYSGEAVLKVKMASSALSGVSSEPFAVAFSSSSWTAASGPSLGVSCTGPSPVAPGSTFTVSCAARNGGDLPAFSVSGGLNSSGSSGGLVQGFGTLAPQASALLSWTVTAPSGTGPYSLVADVSSTSFGESFSANSSFTVQVSGAAPCAYAIGTSGLSVPASGGNVGLTIHTDTGCSWSITNLPAWLSASGSTPETGSATVTLAADANSGGVRSASLSVGGVSVPVRQLDAAACGGASTCALRALPHLAYGGQWTTALSAVSSGTAAASFSASFYGDAGTNLALPFTGLGNLSTLTGTVPAGGLRHYEAQNPSVGDLSGWALVTADEYVTAQATYRRRTGTGLFYEAAVPSSGGYSRFVMPFDVGTFAPNGAQLFAAFAVVNLNPSATAHFVCTARSDSGVLIPNAVSIPALAPLGHYTAFNFPLLTGRGTIDCSADTLVSAIGIRSIGGDAVSTLPVIPK
jgi:subtilisin family serine protease